MKTYEKEIEKFKLKIEKSKKFAEKFPVFEKTIMDKKIDENFTGQIDKKYKDIYFDWGINRYFYKDNRNITNCKREIKDTYLFNIYINTLSLYGSHNDFGLKDLDIKCFFFDILNTTFYIEEKNIEDALNKLNDWYLTAKQKAIKENLLKEKEELLKRLKTIDKKIENNKEDFEILSRQMIQYLNKNHHPHTKIIITTNNAEIVEGVKCIQTTEYIND